jgi:hypothetical protein
MAPASAWHTRPHSYARRVSTNRWMVAAYSLQCSKHEAHDTTGVQG